MAIRRWYVNGVFDGDTWQKVDLTEAFTDLVAQEDVYEVKLPDGLVTPSLQLFAIQGATISQAKYDAAVAAADPGPVPPRPVPDANGSDEAAPAARVPAPWMVVQTSGAVPVPANDGLDPIPFIAGPSSGPDAPTLTVDESHVELDPAKVYYVSCDATVTLAGDIGSNPGGEIDFWIPPAPLTAPSEMAASGGRAFTFKVAGITRGHPQIAPAVWSDREIVDVQFTMTVVEL